MDGLIVLWPFYNANCVDMRGNGNSCYAKTGSLSSSCPCSCCFLKASDKTIHKNLNMVDRIMQNLVLVAWKAVFCVFFAQEVQGLCAVAAGAAHREEFPLRQPRPFMLEMSTLSSMWSTKWAHITPHHHFHSAPSLHSWLPSTSRSRRRRTGEW